jgi:diguanylate cyclase (GGDEF)-like protein
MTRVLITEDSPTQAQELRLVLEADGYEVVHALDGETAIELLSTRGFDLVLSDVQMPGMSGHELCRWIKDAPAHAGLPVILLTRLSKAVDIVRGLECGADNFLTKPYDARHLTARMAAILASHGAATSDEGIEPVSFDFMGDSFEIRAEPERILNFLMSTFEEFVRAQQRELETQLGTEKRRREELGALTSELREMNSRLTRLASIDPMTELLNRRGLDDALLREMNRSQRMGTCVVAALVDLDGFKKVNDQLGHAVGDVVLTEVSKRLASSLRPSDRIGRVGGDEFLVLLPDTRRAEAQKVADRVRLVVSQSPLVVFSDLIHITASIGTAVLPYETCSIEEVLALTRMALHEAKTSGGNKVSSSQSDSDVAATRAEQDGDAAAGNGAQSIEDIQRLLREGEPFRSVSQPIYRLDDGSLAGYELLSRGPAGPFEMPSDFFRVCLEGNFLTMADLKCLKSCVTACTALEPGGRFHVNLFPSTLLDTPPERLVELLDAAGESVFCVEISEQQFISDPACLQEQVEVLRDAGVLVAMDDVGFGRSSLESLVLLEPDIVKIDPKYVLGIARDSGKARSIRRLIKIAESLDAEIVAEGIENPGDLAMLRDMGVGYGQGYLWGVPA